MTTNLQESMSAEQLAAVTTQAILLKMTLTDSKADIICKQISQAIQSATEAKGKRIKELEACNKNGSKAHEVLNNDFARLLQADNRKAIKIADLKSGKQELEAKLAMAVGELRTVAEDFDCDSDAHKYNSYCRACNAQKVLQVTVPDIQAYKENLRREVVEECIEALNIFNDTRTFPDFDVNREGVGRIWALNQLKILIQPEAKEGEA